MRRLAALLVLLAPWAGAALHYARAPPRGRGRLGSSVLRTGTSETLQQNKILRVINKKFTKKCLEIFAEREEKKEDFKKFYGHFGKGLKLGKHEENIMAVSWSPFPARPSGLHNGRRASRSRSWGTLSTYTKCRSRRQDLIWKHLHEPLQQYVGVTNKKFNKKRLEMFAEMEEEKDDYKKSYEQVGNSLKKGVHEDSTNQRLRNGCAPIPRSRHAEGEPGGVLDVARRRASSKIRAACGSHLHSPVPRPALLPTSCTPAAPSQAPSDSRTATRLASVGGPADAGQRRKSAYGKTCTIRASVAMRRCRMMRVGGDKKTAKQPTRRESKG